MFGEIKRKNTGIYKRFLKKTIGPQIQLPFRNTKFWDIYCFHHYIFWNLTQNNSVSESSMWDSLYHIENVDGLTPTTLSWSLVSSEWDSNTSIQEVCNFYLKYILFPFVAWSYCSFRSSPWKLPIASWKLPITSWKLPIASSVSYIHHGSILLC